MPLCSISELYSGIQRPDNSAVGMKIIPLFGSIFRIPIYNILYVAEFPDNAGDDFAKWEKEVKEAEAEAEAEALKNGTSGEFGDGVNERTEVDTDERPSTPPDGEEEFTDDDGTTYKWDRSLRAWVPQVCL